MAKEYLLSTGESSELIGQILGRRQMEREEYEKHGRCENKYVRFMIAANPNIPQEMLDVLSKDKLDYVRVGVASNTSIQRKQVDLLKNDELRVQEALVSNPSVPEDVILEIYNNNKKVSLTCYAKNPKCPEIIRNDIEKSDRWLAKQWLEENKNSNIAEGANGASIPPGDLK